MLRKLGLASAVLGTVMSLALPVSGLAEERSGRNDRESAYSWADRNRGDETPMYRTRFDQNSRREMPFDRAHSQMRRPGGSNNATDRGVERSGSRNSGRLDGARSESSSRRG